MCGKLNRRHNRCNLELVKVMRLAGAYVGAGEPRGLPGFGQGGGDALVLSASAVIGNAITDFTVVHEQQPSMLPRAAWEPLHAAKDAEKGKNDKYEGLSRALGYKFFPLVMEHGGAMGPTLQTFLRALRDLFEAGAQGAKVPGGNWSCSSFMQHAVQRLAVTFQKETADGEVALAQRLAHSQADGFFPPGAAFPVLTVRTGKVQPERRETPAGTFRPRQAALGDADAGSHRHDGELGEDGVRMDPP